MTLQVSVVVPTYNRPELLKRCLDALLRQDLDPGSYEVLVADDGPCSRTCRVVHDLAAEAIVPIRYLPVTATQGPAAARNAGWRAAYAPIVAFTDDDCIPEPDWLRQGLAVFDGHTSDVAAAWGTVVVLAPPVPTDYERSAAGLATAAFVTANIFCRRDALCAAGGFDERFAVAWREDTDLSFTLRERNCRIEHAPDARVVHPIRPAPWGVSLLQQRKSMYNALLYRKHPRLYRQDIQPAPPWHYYRSAAALATALAGTLTGRRGIAVLALIAWSIMTGRFCAQRLRGTSRSPSHIAEMAITSALIPPTTVFWRLYGAWKFRVFFL